MNKYSKYNLRHREAVEILINENVKIDTEKAIERDSNFPLGLGRRRLYHYIADIEQHEVYGHNGEDLVLNNLCPFLLECGYDVPRWCLLDILDKASDKKSKFADHAYLKKLSRHSKFRRNCIYQKLSRHYKISTGILSELLMETF